MHGARAGRRWPAGQGGMSVALTVGKPIGTPYQCFHQFARFRIPAVDSIARQVKREQRSVGGDGQEAVRVLRRVHGTPGRDLVHRMQRLAIGTQDVDGKSGVGGQSLLERTAGHEVVDRHPTVRQHGHVESVAVQAPHRDRADHFKTRAQHGNPPPVVVEDQQFLAVFSDREHTDVLSRPFTIPSNAAEVGAVGREDSELGPGSDIPEGHRETAIGEPLNVPRDIDHRFAVGAQQDIRGQFDRAGRAEILLEDPDLLHGGNSVPDRQARHKRGDHNRHATEEAQPETGRTGPSPRPRPATRRRLRPASLRAPDHVLDAGRPTRLHRQIRRARRGDHTRQTGQSALVFRRAAQPPLDLSILLLRRLPAQVPEQQFVHRSHSPV